MLQRDLSNITPAKVKVIEPKPDLSPKVAELQL
jgi:hypothetical protein